MTDIMKLADDYAQHKYVNGAEGRGPDAPEARTGYARAALQSAIEALQEENALLEGTLESRERNIAEMQAENERLEVESTNKNDWLVEQRKWEAHANALQVKLDAMGNGEPVSTGCRWCKHPAFIVGSSQKCPQCGKVFANAAPKALAPRFTECRIELVGAIHTLASHYENRLGRLDPEDRKLAEGDIAHAMATAAKWNWNGTGIGGTP